MGTKTDNGGGMDYKVFLYEAEMHADSAGLDSRWMTTPDYPTRLEVYGATNDDSYQNGELTRLRFVAHGGDPEAGVKILGMTGNEVIIFEMIIDDDGGTR